ncbi:Vitamin B12 import ATP-binding protein BtuD [bioreactor metagenome]|uniref:Vitamin B12 import ATP-binding protein BtuD n=1 Tax=bioreactor metagenome TaxID=1076179 RepID=A0A644SJE8_9ZZZZ
MKHSLAIKAENISKQYRLGEVGTGTITHDLNRFWAKLRGKEDPYLKIGEANDRSRKGDSEYVWSLRDINFEIEQGDAVGIIGRNGAGKSTLLKLLSKVTKPTTGSFKVNGRIASLLEVGTGFNPEMTGRENIYLNGAILGMRKHEIDRKFDEIVDFSGVERYIDTPVKRYSSGMYVRLAFAVAAHLESEILIVDEVLAVGDAEFQKKCLGKMGDVSKGEGRTVLFVSHNMDAVRSLCNNGIYLKNGLIQNQGDIQSVINFYKSDYDKNENGITNIDSKKIELLKIKNNHQIISVADHLNIDFFFKSNNFESKNVFFDFGIFNAYENMVIHSKTKDIKQAFSIERNSEFKVTFEVKSPNLSPGDYFLTLFVYEKEFDQKILLWIDQIPINNVSNNNPFSDNSIYKKLDDVKSITYPKFNIELTR